MRLWILLLLLPLVFAEGVYVQLEDGDSDDVYSNLADRIKAQYGISADEALEIITTQPEPINDVVQEAQRVADTYAQVEVSKRKLVILDQDIGGSGVYYELVDEIEQDANVELGVARQDTVVFGQPVVFRQGLNVANTANESRNITIDLRDYPDLIDPRYLQESLGVNIFENNEQISELSIIVVALNASESRDLEIVYSMPEVILETGCREYTLQDYLPQGAVVLDSDVDVEQVLDSQCYVNATYDSTIPYALNIPVDFESDSLYELESGVHYEVVNGQVLVN